MNTSDLPPLGVPPSDYEHYLTMARRDWRVPQARRAANEAASHLRRAGARAGSSDPKAASALRTALLRLAATPARTLRELEAKQHTLVKHMSVLEPFWLLEPIIGVALRGDYERLAPSPAEEARLRAMLPMAEDDA